MSKTLLIVEDDPFVRRFYDRLFKLHSYEVVLAEDGDDGLEKARRLLPDLIFLDVLMPNMDGLQLLKELKEDVRTRAIPVIMLTIYGEGEPKRKAFELGAEDYLVKCDVSDEQLLAVVNKYLQ